MPVQTQPVTPPTDDVCLLDANTFAQLVEPARPVRLSVKEHSKVMEHPIETGATITDFTITLPVEISMTLILTMGGYRGVFQQLQQLHQSATLLIVQTRTTSYAPMLIAEMPHEETTDMVDGVTVSLRLKQVLLVTASSGRLPPQAVVHAQDADTLRTGTAASGSAASAAQTEQGGTLLAGWLK
jgi:hypothetical protein